MLTFQQYLDEAVIAPDRLERKQGLPGHRIGQSGQKYQEHTVLWYQHPRMGTRVIDHPGIDAPITHAEWMHQEGIKAKDFDKHNRGRFQIHNRGVDEFLHKGKTTPDEVYNHLKKNYKSVRNHLFTPDHTIKRYAD